MGDYQKLKNFDFYWKKLGQYHKTIEVFEQIYSFRTFIYSRKTMALWEKKLWYYAENYGTLIYYEKAMVLWKKIWYYRNYREL